MQLSVIILNYNVRYFLEQCVLSVQDALKTIDSEIIVVDNNSTDGSCEMIQQRFPDIKFIQNNENIGFPKGNNIGVSQAKGEYICVLNPDTVVANDSFTKILDFVKTKQDLGIVGCKLIDGAGNFLPESKRGIPTPWVSFTKIFGLYKMFPKSKLFNQYYAQHLDENQIGNVEILVGAFMIMKRELYLEVGGFDEKCFMYSDDIDLSYMVLQKGKVNYYFPETTVIHYKGESTVKDGTYMKRFQEAMNFFYKKHFKVSVFFFLFMKIGIVFFSLFKMVQGKNSKKLLPEKYVLVSNNEEYLYKIQNKYQKNSALASLQNGKVVPSQTFSQHRKTELIFDNNCYDFKEIISFMNQNRNEKYSYKILPKACDFIIGSQNSNDRGEITLLV